MVQLFWRWEISVCSLRVFKNFYQLVSKDIDYQQLRVAGNKVLSNQLLRLNHRQQPVFCFNHFNIYICKYIKHVLGTLRFKGIIYG